jgi:serine/threonine protein kinase
MGVVYLAEDTHLARRVAVKFSSAARENEAYRTRFLREARAASALNHPHIARIYDYGESADGQPFLVMELVTGEDLSHLLARGISVLQAMRIAEEVAEALEEAHRSGIIHRDIKPSNIVINERGQVKVLDFGLAKLYREPSPVTEDSPTIATSATAEGTVLGTPAYMSPEQAREAPLAPRSDLFALGAVLYECLTGRRAFAGANSVEILASVLHVDPAAAVAVNARVPPALDAVVAKALAKDPDARYQSAAEMLADLRAARAGMAQPETQETEVLPASTGTAAPHRRLCGTRCRRCRDPCGAREPWPRSRSSPCWRPSARDGGYSPTAPIRPRPRRNAGIAKASRRCATAPIIRRARRWNRR